MDSAAELRTLRLRMEEMRAILDRLDSRDSPAGCAATVLRTKTVDTYPASAGSYFACDVVNASGDEEEGEAAGLGTVATTTVFALNVGTKLPPDGTDVLASVADGRYVFQYDGDEA